MGLRHTANDHADSVQAGSPVDPAVVPFWHALSEQEALELVDTSRSEGLSTAEVLRRRAGCGENVLPAPARRSAMRRFVLQFHNILIHVLLISALITALLGHWVDSAVIVGVVLTNALIGFVQEGKAERALDAIRQLLSFNAQVLREHQRHEIQAHELVRGDIVFLVSGDKVPADVRLIEVHSLRIDESALTGESVASDKIVQAVPRASALGDRRCMAYSGTLVTYGQGIGVVVAIGAETEIGRISSMLAAVQELATPLLRQIAVFGRWLTAVIMVLVGITFGFGIWVREYSATDMFMAAVGLAVAAIPEGLPAIMTITLALGVQRMARRNVIVRRLPVVEALGSVTVICTDKTGTLTRNEMTVRRVITAGPVFAVSGAGYAPHGGFSIDGREVTLGAWPLLQEVGRLSMLCNDASLAQADGQWHLTGDPTEGALIALAMKVGLDDVFEREALPRSDVIPFESEHRLMATLHHDHEGRGCVFVKGAPERILALCSRQRQDGSDQAIERESWNLRMEAAAAEGMRLLAVALRAADHESHALHFDSLERGGFTLLAVLGLADPPRDEAIEAVARCHAAGIRVKMVTGDHVVTARAIGEQLRLAPHIKTLSGAEMEIMDDDVFVEAAMATDVFARTSPEHKLRLVQALQRHGEVVAMTGDGVNDAPALKRADIGIAMGRKGTEAAKEAAEMVLADDNFASIAAAVEEGRAVYDNIRKAIIFILPTNGGEAGMLLIAILLGLTLPITPVQILWVNMVTAITLSLAISFEVPESDVMARPPRDPREPLLTPFLIWRIVFVTVLLVGGGIGLFLWELSRNVSLEVARTIAVNSLVIGEIVYLFNVRRFSAPALSWDGLFGNRHVLLAVSVLLTLQMAFTYVPTMQFLFGTAGLDGAAWLRVAGFGLIVFVLVEIEKWLLHRGD